MKVICLVVVLSWWFFAWTEDVFEIVGPFDRRQDCKEVRTDFLKMIRDSDWGTTRCWFTAKR